MHYYSIEQKLAYVFFFCNILQFHCFYCIFTRINAAFVSISDFLKTLKYGKSLFISAGFMKEWNSVMFVYVPAKLSKVSFERMGGSSLSSHWLNSQVSGR